jgi:adenylate cyclase
VRGVAQPKKRKYNWKLILLLPVPLLWAYASLEGHLKFAENALIDLRFLARGEIESPVRVIYVDMDIRATEELGAPPWPRSNYALVVGALIEQGKAKAVGIDVVFSEKGVSEAYDRGKWIEANVRFRQFLRKNPPVVLAASYAAADHRGESGKRVTISLPLIREGLPQLNSVPLPELPEFNIGRGIMWNPARIGLIDTLDGATRWVPVFVPTSVKRYDHMALALAAVHWGVDPATFKVTSDAIVVPNPDGSVKTIIPLIDQQLVEVNWFSPWNSPTNPRIGFSEVFNYARMLESNDEKARATAVEVFKQFADAIVLIGPVDPLLQDLAPTPFDEVPVPKVGVHGNLLKTLIGEKYLRRPPAWSVYSITLGLTLITTVFSMAGGTRGLRSKLTAVLVLVAYVWFCLRFFESSDLVLPMAAPLGAALSTAFLGVIWQLIIEEKQKGRIKNMFGTYLAPELVNRMVESEADPQLGGHEEVITAYFSDIQSFSTFSELMPASQLVELMNEYLTVCTDIVQEEKGTLDKYIGDAVVAIYGAPLPVPDHAYRACVATIRVQKGIEELRKKWRSEENKWPPIVHYLRARLGLNTGSAIIGNMGSRTRFSYTMMGDNVNLAARMESGAKSLGVYTMVAEATKVECEKHGGDKVVFRFLDKIVVKGRTLPVPVYEVIGLRDEVSQQTFDCLSIHAQAIERYLLQDWDGALQLFGKSATLELYQPSKAHFIESNPSLIMSERCHYFKKHPPAPNWDGVFTMKEK